MHIRINLIDIIYIINVCLFTAVNLVGLFVSEGILIKVWCISCVALAGVGLILLDPFCKKEDLREDILRDRMVVNGAILIFGIITEAIVFGR